MEVANSPTAFSNFRCSWPWSSMSRANSRSSHDLQRLVNISMPEIPFEAFEFFFDFCAQIRLVICIDALGHLTHHRQPHRDVEPVQKMLGLLVQVHLEIAQPAC